MALHLLVRSLCTTMVFTTFTLRLITHHRMARQSGRSRLLNRGDEVEGSSSLHQGGTFLFNYRTSPHTTAGHSPAELMFGRRLRMRLELLKPDLRGQLWYQWWVGFSGLVPWEFVCGSVGVLCCCCFVLCCCVFLLVLRRFFVSVVWLGKMCIHHVRWKKSGLWTWTWCYWRCFCFIFFSIC